MKVLFINACVRENSRTLKLSKAYMAERYNDSAEIREVFLPNKRLQPLDGDMLQRRKTDIAVGDFSSELYEDAKNFADAEEIIIAAPYWDLSFPSMLKVYFEHICVNGITFQYGKDGRIIPLCKAKNLVYITTSGGYIGEEDSGLEYITGLCEMFGIEEIITYTAEGLDISGCNVEAVLNETIAQFSHR